MLFVGAGATMQQYTEIQFGSMAEADRPKGLSMAPRLPHADLAEFSLCFVSFNAFYGFSSIFSFTRRSMNSNRTAANEKKILGGGYFVHK